MNPGISLVAVVALGMGAGPALATQQSCGVWSPEFSGGGFDRSPLDFEAFDAGGGARLFAGGEFTVAGSVQARRVAQWDGGAWTAVGAGFNGDVHDLAPVDFGAGPALYATGRFQSSGGVSCSRIARWTGTAWAALGSGLDGVGWALCEYPTPAGNRLVVGGEFTTAGGQPALRVAVWNGTGWAPLGAGVGTPFASQRVVALAVHDDGGGPALYAGGTFPGSVAKWDGSSWSTVGGGLIGTLQSLASYDDGQGNRYLLAGGNFGTGPTSVLKGWDGSSWQELGLSNYGGGIDRILVRAESGGPVAYLAGSFTPLQGATSNAALIARWTPTAIVALPPLLERVRGIEFFDDGSGEELFAGGMFERLLTAPYPNLQRVARLSGGQWTHVEPPQHPLYLESPIVSSIPRSLRSWTNPVTGERDLYAGGRMQGAADDPTITNLARWDGAAFSRVPTPITADVTSLGEWRTSFSSAPSLAVGTTVSVLAFDGAGWQQLGSPSAMFARVLVEFTPPGAGAPRLHAFGNGLLLSSPWAVYGAQFDGTSWTPMGLGLDNRAYDALVWDAPGALPEGLYVAGEFQNAGGQLSPGLALWDGSAWLALPSGGFSRAFALCVWDDGNGEALYVSTDAGLRRFDGTAWTALGPSGSLLEPYDDGSGPALYLSDRVRLRNGVQEPYGAALVNALYPVAAHHWIDEHGLSQGLYFTGFFQSAGGIPAVGLARYWNPCGLASSYCSAKVNSLGCTPQIGWTGVPSVSAPAPFVITAANVLNQKSGLLFYGSTGRIAKAFQGGTLCIRSPVRRTPVRTSGGSVGAPDCSGVLSLDFTPYLQGALGPGFELGDTVDGQWWYRDPLASFSTGLTDAIEFQVRP